MPKPGLQIASRSVTACKRFVFFGLGELDLRGLATTIICSSGDLRRKAVR
jgi:hypothetical protein